MFLELGNSEKYLSRGYVPGYLDNNDCSICKAKNICTKECKHRDFCKLYVIKVEEGVVKMRRLCENAKLPVRGTPRSAGYDLVVAQSGLLLVHSKVLMKTGLSMALPPGCYGRIAPRSGLALKKI